MNRSLSSRERKLVAVGLLVAVIALFQALVLGPLVDGFAARAEERRLLAAQYQRNDRLIASIGRMRRLVERQRAEAARFALAAPGVDAGRERLKERLETSIQRSGGEFLASDEAQAPAGWAGARADARLTLTQTLALLQDLQNTEPRATIESLAVDASGTLDPSSFSALGIRFEASIPLLPAGA